MTRWDAHMCLPLHPQASFAPIDALRTGGLNYVSINVGMDMNPLTQVMAVIAGFRATIAAHPDRYVQADTVADIERAKAGGQIAIGFDLEGAMPLLEQPEMVALYARLGVRQIHLAYNRNNSVADGCHDVPRGLTALGHRMVRAINAAGMLMDCSHTGRRCSLEIMAASSDPVIFSHANPLALVEHGRNINDEQIRACAATGGVVCISGVSRFLGTQTPAAQDVARHAAYVADLVGVQHVGIGLDNGFSQHDLDDRPAGFEPDYWWPVVAGYGNGIASVKYTPLDTWAQLDAALLAAGFNTSEVALVLGANMLRRAWQISAGPGTTGRTRSPAIEACRPPAVR